MVEAIWDRLRVPSFTSFYADCMLIYYLVLAGGIFKDRRKAQSIITVDKRRV